ncbi:hypothetical protein KDA_36430 [Dictyobacter alpinus]|uniref:Uncharacterized protein n=1 Tax=Dictyobacter alpinus TaxID=2014873 RepID=A0A402BA39_9CHLR|nr:DUF5691 domain-containing protein [Dictyobacter alpinus]GCE28159.1 hypothetical protein KDA_36430 [Dictyobacter alpinus]
MDAFLKNAVVGTDRHAAPLPATDSELDPLITQLPAEQKERSLLLAAGAYAIYSQAGFVAPEAPAVLAQAEPEILPACSDAIAHQFEGLLQLHAQILLPEALQCLQAAQLRLPHTLLPASLSVATDNPNLQQAFLPMLGKRGSWLSQFNPRWNWISQRQPEELTIAEQEILWQEGTIAQRKKILQQLRVIDPAKARDWLQSVWKQEKAEIREDLLHVIATNITSADTPLLEQALNDRSQHVRALAAKLFSYLPETAPMQRILLCADSILNYKNNELQITLPNLEDAQWKGMGEFVTDVTEKSSPPEWLHSILRLVPPPHWEEHLRLSPIQITELLVKLERKDEIINDLTLAAVWHHSLNWYEPLLHWSIEHVILRTRQERINTPYPIMLAALPQEQAEALVMPIVEHPDHWARAVHLLPTPWSRKYSQHFIQTLQKYYAQKNNTNYTAWTDSLPTVASALHPDTLELAQGPWELPEEAGWYTTHRAQQVQAFLALIDIRKQFLKELN